MRKKGWTLFCQEDIDCGWDKLCSDTQRKKCDKDNRCYMVCGTGGGYVNKNYIPNPSARQRAVGTANLTSCRHVKLVKGKIHNLEMEVSHTLKMLGKVHIMLKGICICSEALRKKRHVNPECTACNARELLKIVFEHYLFDDKDSYETAAKKLGVEVDDLRACMEM